MKKLSLNDISDGIALFLSRGLFCYIIYLLSHSIILSVASYFLVVIPASIIIGIFLGTQTNIMPSDIANKDNNELFKEVRFYIALIIFMFSVVLMYFL